MTFSSIAELPTWVLAVGGLIGLCLIVGHVWLSRRNPVWLGAIDLRDAAKAGVRDAQLALSAGFYLFRDG